MAGVLGQIRWPFSGRAELFEPCLISLDPRTQQLMEAKQILAEVFGIKVSEVEEMIRQRCQECVAVEEKDSAIWPEMLWVEADVEGTVAKGEQAS